MKKLFVLAGLLALPLAGCATPEGGYPGRPYYSDPGYYGGDYPRTNPEKPRRPRPSKPAPGDAGAEPGSNQAGDGGTLPLPSGAKPPVTSNAGSTPGLSRPGWSAPAPKPATPPPGTACPPGSTTC